ncbi:MAG: FKBP-type peptidyl-prolyl cis-trans isomerase [Nitrospira sp.]
MKQLSGLTLLEEREGDGRVVQIDDRVVYNVRLYLNKGDEVLLNEKQVEYVPKEKIRIQDGVALIDRTVTLGRREVMAGIEHALIGMKVGGYRKVRISPHLAYRDKGLPELIPPDAVLVVEIWLRAVLEASTVRAQ